MNFHKSHLQPWGLELVNKYPLVFLEADPENASWAKRSEIKEEDYVNLRYGFECGQGWAKHIEEIAKKATEIVTYLRNPEIHCLPSMPKDAYIHSCIVKEKFGTLRWQGNHNLPPLFQNLWYPFVSDEERQTSFTCEVTGEYGSLRTVKGGSRGWVRTLCAEEAMKAGYAIEDWEKQKLEEKNVPDDLQKLKL